MKACSRSLVAGTVAACATAACLLDALSAADLAGPGNGSDRTFNREVLATDWPQLGGSPARNNAVDVEVPTDWNVEQGTNIKWSVPLGSQTYGHPIIANGKVFVGTNNGHGYLKRYPDDVDLGVLLCFRESDGEFLWQHCSEKLSTGRVHDWPEQGICSAPVAESDRLWFVMNRGEVVCLDAAGFDDDEDDGPVIGVTSRVGEIVVRFDGLAELLAGKRLRIEHIATLRPLLQQAGLPRFYTTAPADAPNQWYGISSTSATEKLRLTLSESTLAIEGLREYSGRRVEIRLDPLAELTSGRVPALVRAHLKAAGIEVSDEARPVTLGPEGGWSLAAVADGSPVECQLVAAGSTLVLRRIITHREHEADVVWSLDMMNELGVRQHNMATCAPTIWGDTLFVITSNGVDEAHLNVPAPDAPSFIALDKHTGEVLWTDNSPGKNILHGQWSCPAAAVLGGVPQVIFPGGDGWLYAFRADRWDREKKTPELLWKFDGNPKDSDWQLGGRGTRNEIISVPVIHDGLVYLAMGQDPEHGEGVGHLWCIDPTKRGDVSPELLADGHGKPLPDQSYRRDGIPLFRIGAENWEGLDEGAVSARLRRAFLNAGVELPDNITVKVARRGLWHLSAEIDGRANRFRLTGHSVRRDESWQHTLACVAVPNVVPNPNSAAVWHFGGEDADGSLTGRKGGLIFRRTLASPAIKDGLLVIPDLSGFVHCLDAKTGKRHWECDLFAACWATPLIAGNTVYIGDEDGEVAILPLSASADSPNGLTVRRIEKGRTWHEPAQQIEMKNSIYTAPTVANGVLYIVERDRLTAIAGAD